jgi:hypothetical protein
MLFSETPYRLAAVSVDTNSRDTENYPFQGLDSVLPLTAGFRVSRGGIHLSEHNLTRADA